jgi:hypothetical protein
VVVCRVCSIHVGPNVAHSAGVGGAYIPRWRGEARQQPIHVRVGPNVAHLSVGGRGGGGSEELAHLAGSPTPWVSPRCFPLPVLSATWWRSLHPSLEGRGLVVVHRCSCGS